MNRAALPVSGQPALQWFKSSYSSDQGGNCVEVAAHPSAVHIRDSKVTDGPVLTVEPAAWSAFVHSGTAL
ncbi:DUF397 domain-containing protein [Streptomyces microflavus]|uniref:DUF397 domain-containing protein n=1 Tax=Streptomyces microflavus TaxID=1919 RepID=UPI002259229F|nr:DUF397 domain-containing protein [Streptomyces microflavus]MCX4655440.1 DUF397 domain-containing protein [Streptomyces microflavus]MDX2406125.1 DUF397 domain-containing protein [Streptomyces microflavus]